MLKEAKAKHQQDIDIRQAEERDRVAKLAAEIEEERRVKAQIKVKNREAALKIIKDNMMEKKKRMAEEEVSKKQEAEQV